MSRPTDDPGFATATNYAAGPHAGQPNKARPGTGIIGEGFDPSAGLPAEWLNYLVANHGTWLKWLLTLPTTSSDAPQYVYQDAAGNTRTVFDHIGYPAGRRSEFRENWDFGFQQNLSLSDALLVGQLRWNGTLTSGARGSLQSNISGGVHAEGQSVSALMIGAIANDLAIINAAVPWVNPQTYTSTVFEFEVSGSTAANTHIFTGLTDHNHGSGVAPSNTTPWFGLAVLRDTSANWQLVHGDGTTLVYTDLGTGPGLVDSTFGPGMIVRIELHDSGSPYGACGRLFLNGVQYGGNITSNIPQKSTLGGAGLIPSFGMKAVGASNCTLTVGPLYLTYNRVALNSPSL